jgi:hypothetical protein
MRGGRVKLLLKAWLLGSVFTLMGCSPSATRSPDGLLIFNGEFPTVFNASENNGVLFGQGRCIVFAVEGVGRFQPVFRKGTTRAALERELGTLSVPRAVTTMGFEWNDSISKQLATSMVVKECPGAPFLSIGFALAGDREVLSASGSVQP